MKREKFKEALFLSALSLGTKKNPAGGFFSSMGTGFGCGCGSPSLAAFSSHARLCQIFDSAEENAPWLTRGGAFLLGKRNAVLVATLTERRRNP